jgi:hypothetical protein
MKDNDERYWATCRRIHRGEDLLRRVQHEARGRVTYSRSALTALVTDVQEWAKTVPTNPPAGQFQSRSQKQGEVIERLLSFLEDQLATLDVVRYKETHPRMSAKDDTR